LDRLGILAPGIAILGLILSGFAIYCVLCLVGRPPQVVGLDRRQFSEIVGPFLTRYLLWIIKPVEKVFVKARVSPNALTFASVFVCAGSGAAIAAGLLATGAWLYILAGVLDVMDGRLARATNQSSNAGAFLDSVADRWGELFVFAGFAWFLRDSTWLAVVMLAVGGSLMVSYTRARGEALGVKLDGGTMQRAERILLVSIGTLCTSWFNAADDTAEYGPHVIGVALLMVGVASSATAISRWVQGYRIMTAREKGEAESREKVKIPVSSKHHPVT
jgi:CDP-diacylglycerol--glycerol-3-phosphate 3-phosphatidyltransferase